ncbi:hypothetical protein [Boudabousia marimammalium]|uniref:Uncharacterized protein n=1 Tax=Boudabousia marimammalium TaxID=156892 RepID=A0A1Q5PM48_9ACTO|nr:hypothetical protein [Boudabousia marimammalium]OKL48614.1 hypothetical protein BM477_05235 [Boudabousia marimammalium]
MLKKITLAIIAVLASTIVFGAVVFGYTFDNLKSYSVYYAQHTPHKPGTEPVLMELTQNLFWVNTPDIDGIEYDYDGGNAIYNSNYKKTGTPYLAYFNDNSYSYGNGGFASYHFDKNFQLISASNRTDRIDLDTVDIEELKREIYRTVQPVIDAQYGPLINLQWLYDWVNKDKFN